MRPVLLSLILALVPGFASARTCYLDVVNTASSSIASFAVAPAGGASFRDIALGDRPLRGGGDSVTIALDQADGGCLRDLRIRFADGRVLVQKGLDVCKVHRYHTGRLSPAKAIDRAVNTLAGQ
jgi:hypothetical protein